MKKYRFYPHILLTIFLLGLSTGCENEFLELEARDELPASLALNNIAGLEATMLQVVQGIGAIHQSSAVSFYKQAGTDLVKSGTNLVDESSGGVLGMQEYNSGLSAVSSNIEGLWNGYYTALNRCLRVIKGAGVIPPKNETEEADLSRFKGEAHAMLAYVYLHLVRRFDNIPLSTLQEEGQEPSLDAPLVEKSVVYDSIISNCQKAIELLPSRANTPGVGSPSKGLANMVLLKAYLDLGNWAEAATAAEAIISDASYQLQPLDGIFGLEGGKTGEENNNEIIFSLLFDPSNVNRVHMYAQMYVPLYDRIPGVARTMDTGGRPWGRFVPSDYYWELWEDGDGRLEAWHKLNWVFDDEENLPDGKNLGDAVTEQDVIDQFGEGSVQLRYIEPSCTKTWEDGTYGRTTGEAGGWRNVIVYRYAEAFILGAEAHWRNGNEGRALELINTIRERAFGDSDHNYTNLTDDILLDEQARELGHEGHRWAMLKRLGLLVERVRLYNPNGGPNIQDKHVRWPIPQSFIDLARVEQNIGY